MKFRPATLLLLVAVLGLHPVTRAQEGADNADGETQEEAPAADTNEDPTGEAANSEDEPVEEPSPANCDCPPPPEPEPKPESGFSGEGGLGWIVNSGNTNNESFNGNLGIKYRSNAWLHAFALSGKRVEEEQVTTAERYLFTGKTDYNYGENGYAFTAVRYDDDEFDGFEYQASLSTGLGWHIINTDEHHFDVEFGIGYRRNEPAVAAPLPAPADEDAPTEEIIGRFAEHYDVMLGDSTQLFQDLLVESGDSNTTSEFGLGLKLDVNDSVALQVSYNVKRNSDPPPSGDPDDPTVKTDRTTRVTLVFGF